MGKNRLRHLPLWARASVYLGGGITVLAVETISTWSLYKLGMMAGHGEQLRAACFPIAVDAGSAVAGAVWVAAETDTQRVTGRNITLGLVAASILFNACEVLAEGALLSPSVLLLISVGMAVLFPAAAFLVGHIVLMVRAHSSAVVANREERVEDELELDKDRQKQHEDEDRQHQKKLDLRTAAPAPTRVAPAVPPRKAPVNEQNAVLDGYPGESRKDKVAAYIVDVFTTGQRMTAPEVSRAVDYDRPTCDKIIKAYDFIIEQHTAGNPVTAAQVSKAVPGCTATTCRVLLEQLADAGALEQRPPLKVVNQ